jgi:hypothetical protein
LDNITSWVQTPFLGLIIFDMNISKSMQLNEFQVHPNDWLIETAIIELPLLCHFEMKILWLLL